MPIPVREVDVEVLPAGGGGRRLAGKDDPIAALVARVMDTLFTIPGTKIRFGLDPLIGLIPGFGSPASALVSLLMIARSAQQGVPNVVLLRMVGNVLVNAILDAIPILGDGLSIFYRSNARNHELMLKHAGTRKAATMGDKLFLLALFVGVILFLVIVIVGALTVAGKFFGWIAGN